MKCGSKKWTAKLRDTVQILNGDLAIWLQSVDYRELPALYERSLKMQSRCREYVKTFTMSSTLDLLSQDIHPAGKSCPQPGTRATSNADSGLKVCFHNMNYQI